MIRGLVDHSPMTQSHPVSRQSHDRTDAAIADYGVAAPTGLCADTSPAPRRTPRVSVVVVLPENHTVSPERLLEGVRANGGREVDVLIACAGQPTNLSALQRCVGEAQFLLAPAGTSTADLRELAMAHAPGDIVTLVGGSLLRAAATVEQPLFKSS